MQLSLRWDIEIHMRSELSKFFFFLVFLQASYISYAEMLTLPDGSSIELAREGQGEEMRYHLKWHKKEQPGILIWSAPRQPPPENGVQRPSSIAITGIEAGIIGNGMIAVLLREQFDGILIRGKVGGQAGDFKRINLRGLMSNDFMTVQKFTLNDAFTVVMEESRRNATDGKSTKHTITVPLDGRLSYDGGDYEDALGIVKFTPQPDGTYLAHDPKGLYGPKGDSILKPAQRPHLSQQGPDVNKSPRLPSAVEDGASSLKVYTWLAISLAVIGLLWLLLKKRK